MIAVESLVVRQMPTRHGVIAVEIYQDDAEYDWCARIQGGKEFLRGFYSMESLVEDLPVDLEAYLDSVA